MRLTEIAEQVRKTLETAPTTLWSNLRPGLDIPLINAISPLEVYSREGKAIYILCDNVEYGLEEPRTGRTHVHCESRLKLITVAVSAKITGHDEEGLDVTNWETGKLLLNLKEEIDEAIIRYGWRTHKLQLKAAQTQPAGESELEMRYFLASTQFGFIDACTLESLSTPPS